MDECKRACDQYGAATFGQRIYCMDESAIRLDKPGKLFMYGCEYKFVYFESLALSVYVIAKFGQGQGHWVLTFEQKVLKTQNKRK